MVPTLFSISYAGLWGQASLDLPTFIARAGRVGFASVMLAGKRPHLSTLDATPERITALRAALAEARVRCDVIAAYTHLAPWPNVASEVPVLEFQLAYVESLARIAQQLGARIVRVFTAYEVNGVPLQKAWQLVVQTLREMGDRVASYGVTLAVQNHHDVALDTSALLDLIAEVDRPNVRLGFDAWSPALRGEDLYQSARRVAPWTVLTTNADYERVPRYHYRPELVNYERVQPDWVRAVPFGTGFIDYAAFFAGLREGGFDGLAAYEICSPIRGGGTLENLDACAKAYLDWFTNHIA